MTRWRDHPKLHGQFHPDAPDDVQVIVHDGGPRITDRSPEAVWVTVTGCDGNDVFIGRVLNQPQQLQSIAQGTEIKLPLTKVFFDKRIGFVIFPIVGVSIFTAFKLASLADRYLPSACTKSEDG